MKKFMTVAAALMMLTSANAALAQASKDAQKAGSMAAEAENGRTKDCEDASMTEEMKAQCLASAQQGSDAAGVDATGSTVPLEGENTDKKTDGKAAN